MAQHSTAARDHREPEHVPGRPAATPAAAPSTARPHRVLALDAARGLAVALMALDHSAFFTRINVVAERYAGRPTAMGGPAYEIIGLLTNVAAPMFWLLSGISIALLAEHNRWRFGSEWPTTRFLLVRAAVLVAIEITVMPLLWARVHHFKYGYDFELLSALAVSMVLMSALRFLPPLVLVSSMLALFAGYPWLLANAHGALAHGGLGARMWLAYDMRHSPGVAFPVLGWIAPMGIGYALGRNLWRPVLRRPLTWAAMGVVSLLTWLALGLDLGYGTFATRLAPHGGGALFIMSKGPPGLDFMAFNLGLAAFALALLWSGKVPLDRGPGRWLVVFGQAPLFVYVLHLAVYKVIGRAGLHLAPRHDALRYALVWIAGMAIMFPLARGYRLLKERAGFGALRYL